MKPKIATGIPPAREPILMMPGEQRHDLRQVAHGVYMDKSVTVEDQTEAGAMQRWRTTAESTAVLTRSDL